MPACPTCHKEYPAGTGTCADDGSALTGPGATDVSSAPTIPGDSLGAASASAALASMPDPLVGTTVAGRYEVVSKIGEGGMGAVYEAKHTVIGKRVAVKVLLEKFHDKSSFVARLLQEARLASSIGHENIVDVTDFGTTDDGRSFVVMEFLDGESLAQLCTRDAPLPVDRCLRICRQVASALSAAHAKGILHRDVKPENVYLVRRAEADWVKVVDFGISKVVRTGEDSPEMQRLTHTSMVLGTPLYMSPEQARGEEDVDHRADIWALGVMFYECLTGEVPFRAANYLGIIAQVQNHQPPSPARLRPELGIPEAVDSVVMRAMEKDRTKRYQLMADLERDFERLLAGDQNVGTAEAPRVPLPSRSPGRRWPMGIVALGAIAIGVALALSQPGAPPRAELPPPAASTTPRPQTREPTIPVGDAFGNPKAPATSPIEAPKAKPRKPPSAGKVAEPPMASPSPAPQKREPFVPAKDVYGDK